MCPDINLVLIKTPFYLQYHSKELLYLQTARKRCIVLHTQHKLKITVIQHNHNEMIKFDMVGSLLLWNLISSVGLVPLLDSKWTGSAAKHSI